MSIESGGSSPECPEGFQPITINKIEITERDFVGIDFEPAMGFYLPHWFFTHRGIIPETLKPGDTIYIKFDSAKIITDISL